MAINGKLIVRSLFRDKGYPVLNIIGLAIGFACSFAVLVWVKNELSYDKISTREGTYLQTHL